MRPLLCIALVVAATLASAAPAFAQSPDPAGIHRASLSTEQLDASMVGARALSAPSVRGAAHGVLIGAGVGAAVGLLLAAATPHGSSDDGAEGFIVAGTLGAFLGMVVGGAIGATR